MLNNKKHFILLFSWLVFCYCFLIFRNDNQSFNIGIITGIILLIQTFQVLNGEIRIAKYLIPVLIIIILAVIVFPVKPNAPFEVFNLSFFRSLFFLIPILLSSIKSHNDISDRFIFLFPLSFLIIINVVFTVFNFAPLDSYDNARHIANSFILYDLITSDQPGKLFSVITYYDFYQPLTYITALPFIHILGKSTNSAILSMALFWLPVGYYFCYQYLNKFLRTPAVASASISFILMGCVFSSSMTKHFLLDLPCFVMVIAYNYSICKSNYFSSFKGTFISGLVFGLGILTKSNFLMLALIPFTVYTVRILIKPICRKTYNFYPYLRNILAHVSGIVLFGGFWYLINTAHYHYELPNVTTLAGEMEGDPKPGSFASNIWYLKAFLYYFSLPVILSLIIGIYIKAKNFKKNLYFNLVCVLSLVLAYAIGTFTWNKDFRTLFPAIFYFIPFIQSLYTIKNQLLSKSILYCMLVWTFFINTSFTTGIRLGLPDIILPHPYVLNDKPLPPSKIDFNEAYYTYNFLFKSTFADSCFQPPMTYSFQTTECLDKLYNNIYKKSINNVLACNNNRQILFLRDEYWPDYYLYEINKLDSTLIIKELNRKARIGGDFFVELFFEDSSGKKVNQELAFNSKSKSLTWQIPTGARNLAVKCYVIHSHPSAALVQFVLKNFNIDKYAPHRVSLIPLNSTNPVSVISEEAYP